MVFASPAGIAQHLLVHVLRRRRLSEDRTTALPRTDCTVTTFRGEKNFRYFMKESSLKTLVSELHSWVCSELSLARSVATHPPHPVTRSSPALARHGREFHVKPRDRASCSGPSSMTSMEMSRVRMSCRQKQVCYVAATLLAVWRVLQR